MVFSKACRKGRLLSTANTTGTFGVHRCGDDPTAFSDEVEDSKDQGITVTRLSPNQEGIFGYLKDSMTSKSSFDT
jgi:hypothetical protein